MKRGIALVASCFGVCAVAPSLFAQAIGPDCINSGLNDVARHGTNAAGTITGYSSGSITCNHGDMPMAASPNSSIRPLVGMNMYRFRTVAGTTRFEQLGQGWAKWVGVPVNGTNSTCGVCSGGGSGTMGVNCADVYSSGFNGAGGMGPRSRINPTTGYLVGNRGGGTDETTINTRVQVPTADVTNQPAGTRFYFETVDFLPDDAQYVRPGQRVAVNAMNNATSQEININAGTSTPSLLGTAIQVPAIARWHDLDPSVTVVTADHDDTPNPNTAFPNTTIRSRYYVAAQVTALAGGLWRYEYAVYNLNSDRGCGSFTLPLRRSASFGDFTFHHPPSHSGEPYSNVAWAAGRSNNKLEFRTDKYEANVNANAVRWGTMYNIGFTTNAAPETGYATLGLFKPGALTTIYAIGIPTPPSCPADFNLDDAVTIDDLVSYVEAFAAGSPTADVDNDSVPNMGIPDGGVTIEDLLFYVTRFTGGC